jgi:hypothetical protein
MTLAAVGAVMCGEPVTGRADPDPRLQAAIGETVSAIARHDATAGDRIAALVSLAAGRRDLLILQVALHLEGSDGTERSMAGAILLRQLAFTPPELIGTLVPRLDGARPALRRVFTEMLGTIDRREGGAADFRVYEAWLAGRDGPPPAGLVRYLYEVSPGAAQDCLRRVHGGAGPGPEIAGAIRELQAIVDDRDASRVLTEKERARAAAALETISRDPAWWVRRYAAEILRGDATLGTPAIMQRLKADPEPLVRDGLGR